MKLSIYQIKQLNKLNGHGAMFAGKPEYFFDTEKSDVFVAAVTHECGILWNNGCNFGLEDVNAALKIGIEEGYYPLWLLSETAALKKITRHMQEKSFFAVANERPILKGSKKASPKHAVRRVASETDRRMVPIISEKPNNVLNKEELFELYTGVLESAAGELKLNNQPINRSNIIREIQTGIKNKTYPASVTNIPEKILQSAISRLNSGDSLGSPKFRERFFTILNKETKPTSTRLGNQIANSGVSPPVMR